MSLKACLAGILFGITLCVASPVRAVDRGTVAAVMPYEGAVLSLAALRVSAIAARNGDADFVMVDKPHGKIIVFEAGRPIFIRPALTGEGLADQIPPDAWYKPFFQQGGVKYKVTPAGRFTLTRNHSFRLGELFDINELRGRDWAFAIHQVWLGNRSEHRDARLRSGTGEDTHITNGCVDVDPSTLAQLLRVLPASGMPLYIVPNDETQITRLFRVPAAPVDVSNGLDRAWRRAPWNTSATFAAYFRPPYAGDPAQRWQ